MPYIEGETLDVTMRRRKLGLSEVVRIATQVGDALAEAHSQRIIHRDIKPANIIITPRAQAKVMDFGLAKIKSEDSIGNEADTRTMLTTPGLIMGTLTYMSPEQVKGEQLDERTDIFSFGVLLYQMLTGNQPFACDTAAATAAAILTLDPPDVPPDMTNGSQIQKIVLQCLQKDRDRRYQTMREVVQDLHNMSSKLEGLETKQSLETETETKQNTLASPTNPSIRLSRKTISIGLASVAILLAGSVLTAFYFRRNRIEAPAPIKSLAVLPLNNLSGDKDQEYFADGMTEAVISALGRISALRVISRHSVMPFKDSRKSLPDIARELNVDAVIEGSVQRAGDQVRITVNLIRADTDHQLWSQTYNRNLSNVLAFQSEVAAAITREIQVTLTPQERARLSGGREVNSEAYDEYLQGKFHGVVITDGENQLAIKFLERAVALDPNFAMGYAELAQVYTRRLNSFAPEDPEWEKKANNAVEKALLLDPDLAEAHLARGLLMWTHTNHFPHEKAAAEYRKAVLLNPNLDEAHHQLCVVYQHVGMLDEALREIQTAVAINPANTFAQYRVGSIYLYQGRAQEALAVFQKYQNAPAPSFSGFQEIWALNDLGRRDDAWRAAEETLRRDPEDAGGAINSMMAIIAAANHDVRRAEELIKAAQSKEKGFIHFHHTAYNIACAYALMNRSSEAVEWLQKAASDGLPCYSLFLRDHNFDGIRQDPRFIGFMAKQKEQSDYYKSKL